MNKSIVIRAVLYVTHFFSHLDYNTIKIIPDEACLNIFSCILGCYTCLVIMNGKCNKMEKCLVNNIVYLEHYMYKTCSTAKLISFKFAFCSRTSFLPFWSNLHGTEEAKLWAFSASVQFNSNIHEYYCATGAI